MQTLLLKHEYKIARKNYGYTIPAFDLKVQGEEESNSCAAGFYINPFGFGYQKQAATTKPEKPKTREDFLIYIDPNDTITVVVERSISKDEFEISMLKHSGKTLTQTLKCFLDKKTLENLLSVNA